MIGAIIGDIVGSRFERANIKTKDFKLFTNECRFTDDTVMSIAVAKSLLECGENFDNLSIMTIKNMKILGNKYINAGYGGSFMRWLMSEKSEPYNSWGNGSAMRVSAIGWVAKFIFEVAGLSRIVTEITHNHPEGIKGAEAVAKAIYMARTGCDKDFIRKSIEEKYYKINFTLDQIRDSYKFDVSCQGSVPQAFEAFFESTDFEDAIRNAISIGGDSDTIACITGSIAEAYYGVPEEIKETALTYLTDELSEILIEFDSKYAFNKNVKYYFLNDGNSNEDIYVFIPKLKSLGYDVRYWNIVSGHSTVIAAIYKEKLEAFKKDCKKLSIDISECNKNDLLIFLGFNKLL